MANLKNLKKFSDYDATRKPVKDIKAEELNNALQNMKNKNAEMLKEQTHRDRVLQERINRLIPIIRLAEQSVNERIRRLNTDKVRVTEFNLATTLSVSSIKNSRNGLMTRFNYNVVHKGSGTPSTLNLNIDVNKFLKYSAVESYTILTSTLYKSVVGSDNKKYYDLRRNSPKDLKREADNERTNDIRFTFKYSLGKFKLKEHVKKLLEKLKATHEIYSTPEQIVEDLLKYNLTEKAIIDIANDKFPLKKLDEKIGFYYTSEYGYSDSKALKMEDESKRVNRTNEEQKWLVTDRAQLDKVYGMVETTTGKGSRSELVNGQMSKDEELKRSFNDVKGLFDGGFNKTPANMEKLQTYCTNFTNSYMSAHGLGGIEIKFLNDPSNPAMGEYFDCGSDHYIEINLAKVDGLVELTATLSHELTHAVDSCYHKEHGQYNAYGGGILDGTSTDISNSGLTGEAKKVLKNLNMLCYNVDPCEQRARNGEHIGLDFIEKLSGSEFKDDLETYRNGFDNDQAKVDELKANLPQSIAEYERKIAGLGLSESSRGYQMLMEKIKYLKERAKEYENLKTNKEANKRARENIEEEIKRSGMKGEFDKVDKNEIAAEFGI